jgi:hypothetical protein
VIRCWCCEAWEGHSLDACDCTADYCPRCLLCEGHCVCEPVPVVVRDEPADDV